MHYHLKAHGQEAIVASLGGELISLTDRSGTQRIWWGDAAVWGGRNPLLFPIVGRLHDDTVSIDGADYHMNQHGIARRREFSLTAQGEDFIELSLCADAETLPLYPFRFALSVRHTLTDTGFTTAITVENQDRRPMPFFLGAHTGFVCPLQEGERFEDYLLRFPEKEQALSMPIIPGGGIDPKGRGVELNGQELALNYEMFDSLDTLVFDGLRSASVELTHKSRAAGVRVDFEGFPMLAFWTKPHARAPYLCIEPWAGCAWQVGESGVFTDKPHCQYLDAGAQRTYRYRAAFLGQR